jgi:hypothetical protein
MSELPAPASTIGTTPPPSEKFAEEPADFGQMHKVHTDRLEWCEQDVRALRRFAWRAPVAFAAASVAGSLCVNGAMAAYNYSPTTAHPDPPTIDYVLAWGGGFAAVILVIVGLLALLDHYSMVDRAAGRLKELRY